MRANVLQRRRPAASVVVATSQIHRPSSPTCNDVRRPMSATTVPTRQTQVRLVPREIPPSVADLHGVEAFTAQVLSRRYTVALSIVTFGLTHRRCHISIGGLNDVPPWRVCVAIAHQLRPECEFVIGIPRARHWLNENPNVLHLLGNTDANLSRYWEANGRGDEPT